MSKNPARCINLVFFSKKGSNFVSVSIHPYTAADCEGLQLAVVTVVPAFQKHKP